MSRYRCIQRVGFGTQTTLEKVKDSVRNHPRAWQGAALFAPVDFNWPEDVAEKKLARFTEQVRSFREMNVHVQFNVGYVMGHGDFQSNVPAITPHMIGPEGETCVVSVCPRSEELKERLGRMFARLAELDPECIWIDDDFRVYDHSPVQCACFCDDCIAKFNAQYRHTFTRPQLNEALLKDHFPEDNPLRREWLTFMHDGMRELMESISNAVHRVNPHVVMGLMTAGAEYNIFDLADYRDYARVMLNDEGKVYFRPGAFFYSDKTPFESVQKAFAIAVTNQWSRIEGLSAYSEIVICPYYKRGKSHKITAWEAALHIGLGGCEGVTFEAIQGMIDEMDGYIGRMDEEYPFLNALSDSLAGHKQVGFLPYFAPDMWIHADAVEHMRQMHDFPFAVPDQLLKIGAPLTADPEGALGVVLCGNTVKGMSREELTKWLGKAVYADADAAKYIDQILGRHALGVEITGPVTNNMEHFTDHPLNAPHTGFLRGGHWAGYGHGCANMKCVGAQPLSQEKDGNVGTAVYETPEGGKAAVLARAPWSDDIQSFPKSTQILNILDWLCGQMPVRLITENRVGQSFWRGEKDDICFLFSMDFDDTEDLTLRLARPAKAERLMKDGTWQSIGEGQDIRVGHLEAFTCTAVRLTAIH